LSSENVSSPYDDRLDKVDPGGDLQRGGVEGFTSPTNLNSPLPSSVSREGVDMTSVPPRPSSRTTSAPTSPLKETKRASFLGKVTSISQVVSAKVEQARDQAAAIRGFNKDRCFTLLVIDDQNTDWSKYFRGKKIHQDWDIRVEQAEFRELSVTGGTDIGVTANVISYTNQRKVVRSFKPDFLLVRQNLRDANEDYKSLLLGLQYGGVPSINSLQSIYNFQDRPWVYAHMMGVQKKLGKEKFPLIDQTYYPNHNEMVSAAAGKLPCVLKVGHAHNGLGKVKVESNTSFQDLASVVAVSNSYCTVENYVDAKYDLHIFKIGSNYRALMRKSLSGQWKTNMGQSILEEIPVNDKYRSWIDAVSEMFGGLTICSLEAVVAKDGKEFIIEVNDSATGLLGESQEEDRRHIAELVFNQMETSCQPPKEPKVAGLKDDDKSTLSRPSSSASVASGEIGKAKAELQEVIRAKDTKSPAAKESVKPKDAKLKDAKPKDAKPPRPAGGPRVAKEVVEAKPRQRHDSADSTGSDSSSGADDSSASSTVKKGQGQDSLDIEDEKPKQRIGEDGEVLEGEDTMKNLRTTFAGIFGDLK